MYKEWLAICKECDSGAHEPMVVGPGDCRFCPDCRSVDSLVEVDENGEEV